MARRRVGAVLASMFSLAASPLLAHELPLAPPPAPYSVGEILPCLEEAQRDVCLLRIFARKNDGHWLLQWVEVYSDPDLAAVIGLDKDSLHTGGQYGALLEALSLDRRGAPPKVALKPFDRLIIDDPGERNHGVETSALITLVEMGRDPEFPLRRRPSLALQEAAAARLKAALRDDAAILRPDEAAPYVNLLIRWGDTTGAEQIDELAWAGNDEHPLDEAAVRAERLARLGHIDAAAQAAVALKLDVSGDPAQSLVANLATVGARETVAREAERQGRKDIALEMARRLLDDACSNANSRPELFQFRRDLRNADSAEAAHWTECVEARSTTGDDKTRTDAALAAFRAWRVLGHPERANLILEAWGKQNSSGSADYDFQPKGAVISMLLAEGRVDDAWSLDPSPNSLFKLDNDGSGNVDRILAKVDPSDTFAALSDCVAARPFNHDLEQCADRLEAAAATPTERLNAARLTLGAIWPDTGKEYGPWSYETPPSRALIESRFQTAARLLRAAADADPATLQATLDAFPLRNLVRMSLDSTLIAQRAMTSKQ
jgi:hypothetical protein